MLCCHTWHGKLLCTLLPNEVLKLCISPHPERFMTLQDKDQLWLHSRTFSAISIAVAAVCLSCMLVVLGWGTHLTVKAVQSGKLW